MVANYTFADWISNILSSPIVSSIFGILAPFLLGYQDVRTIIVLIVVGIVIYGILPFMPTFLRIARGNEDIFFSKIEERPKSFFFGICVYILSYFVFIVLGFIYYAIFSLSSLIMAFLALTITLKWKVSIHMIGFCTPLTILAIVSKGLFTPILLLTPILMWARVKTKAHSWAQVVVGAFLGVTVPYFSMTILVSALIA
ncbi:MAG: hypothetical protein QXJ17_04100 [Nitrososphaeria archaeon]